MLAMVAAPAQAALTYTATAEISHIVIADADEFTFYVERSYALGLDAAYWNWTVYCVPTAGIPDYGGATNATYYVHIHVYDGSTNLTKNVTLAAKNDLTVYSNASHANGAFAALDNGAAVYTIELIKGAPSAVATAWVGTVNLYSSAVAASMINALMLIIPVVIVVIILGFFGKLTGNLRGKFGGK
jgi:hypothetical protein